MGVLGGQYGTVLELNCGALLRDRTRSYKWLRKIIYVIAIRMKCSKVIPKFLRLLHFASLRDAPRERSTGNDKCIFNFDQLLTPRLSPQKGEKPNQ